MNQKIMKHQKRYIWEITGVIIITIIVALFAGNLKGISMFIPLLYMFIEKKVRHRSWETLGFKFKNTLKNIKQNWFLVLLVGFITPVLTIIISNHFLPGYVDHLKSRIPILKLSLLIPLFLNFLIGGFGEELVFRGLFQERLSWFLKTPTALVLSAIIFSIVHFSPGSFAIVSFDLFGIFVDALIYGVIYHRTRNVFASWTAHVISDSFGVICILYFTSALS